MVVRLRRSFLPARGLAWLAAILFVGAVSGYIGCRLQATRHGPMSVQELKVLERDFLKNPQEPDAAVELLIGYSALLGQFGDIERAVELTLEAVREDPKFAEVPKVKEAQERLRNEWSKLQASVGIASDAHQEELLVKALAHARGVLDRTDLEESQRSAAHLARGRLWLERGEPRKAIEDAQRSLDPVSASLLRADAHVDMQNWGMAIAELRGASLALTSWANREPTWELKLLWSMGRGRRWRQRQWRERREEIAKNLRAVIADEIRVLRGLERLEQLR